MELEIDRQYRNTGNWRLDADEFNRFFRFDDGGIRNMGGFRAKKKAGGSTAIEDCAFCILVTDFSQHHWPDTLNVESGLFTYFGDNQSPGSRLEETSLGGNRLLATTFNRLHSGQRQAVAPFLCFQSMDDGEGSSMRFLGLAAPGAQGVSPLDDLVAVWRVADGKRFANYRALFTILDAPVVPRSWIEDLVAGVAPAESRSCPPAWSRWQRSGTYSPLRADVTARPRSRVEQAPSEGAEAEMLKEIMATLSPREFEFAARSIVELLDPRFVNMRVTKASRDGGRDVIANYRVGHPLHNILLNAVVEAKMWDLDRSVGVRPVSRLLSRLRHRDVAVFVTTSYFDAQVQSEIIEDGHPVILISGSDIVRLLIEKGVADPTDPSRLRSWLQMIKKRLVLGD